LYSSSAWRRSPSLAYSELSEGILFSSHPFIHALRIFGLGIMAAALVLWIDLCREVGGRPELTPLYGITTLSGSLLLLISLMDPFSAWSSTLGWAGLSINAAALLVGFMATIVRPAYPSHLAVAWPDGGLEHPDPHVPALDLRRLDHLTIEPQDLTEIDGIGPAIQSILNQAGIVTFDDIAHLTPERLRDLLRVAHLRAPVDTTTWPSQAAELDQRELVRHS
jgi:hypothetical protein